MANDCLHPQGDTLTLSHSNTPDVYVYHDDKRPDDDCPESPENTYIKGARGTANNVADSEMVKIRTEHVEKHDPTHVVAGPYFENSENTLDNHSE